MWNIIARNIICIRIYVVKKWFLLQYINNKYKPNTSTETAQILGTRFDHLSAEFIILVCRVQSFSLRTMINYSIHCYKRFWADLIYSVNTTHWTGNNTCLQLFGGKRLFIFLLLMKLLKKKIEKWPLRNDN